VRPRSINRINRTNRISKRVNKPRVKNAAIPISFDKIPKKTPTTESLIRNADWEELLLKIPNKSHLQKTQSWINGKI